MEFKFLKKIVGISLFTFVALSAVAQETNSSNDGKPPLQSLSSAWWFPWLVLLLSVIAIVLHLFRFRITVKPKNVATNKASDNALKQEVGYLKGDISKRAMQSDVAHLNEKLLLLEERIKYLEQPPPRQLEWEIKRKSVEPVANIPLSNDTAPQQDQPGRELVYAKYADLAEGFSSGMILPAQNGELVYEILITGDTAVYRISADRNAQKYALSEFAFTLGKACDFVNQPFKGCHIVLQKEGTLNNVDGDWIISQKAKIEFK